MEGVVVRRSGSKTVAVEVTRVYRHPRYSKTITRSKRYLVHDPADTTAVGATVHIRETRPLSARKRWLIVGRAKAE